MELVGFALSGALVYLAVHIWPNPPAALPYRYYVEGPFQSVYEAK